MKLLGKMKILILILIFFVIGALFIISNNNLAMHEEKNIKKFSDIYLKWVDEIYLNTQILTEEIIKLNWLPENSEDNII